jgi:hypothetical protein
MKNLSCILILFLTFGCVSSEPTLSNTPETLNDLKEYRSKKELDAFRYAWEELPKERQVKLAYHLLQDSNGLTVYRGTQLLIKNGKEEDCFHALARLIAEGKDKTDLKGRMGWDWVHSYDDKLMGRMMKGILTYMNDNYSSYSLNQKKNILSFFKKIGYTGDYDKQRIQKQIDLVIKNKFSKNN